MAPQHKPEVSLATEDAEAISNHKGNKTEDSTECRMTRPTAFTHCFERFAMASDVIQSMAFPVRVNSI
jgi:hypothetical protein